MQRTGRLALLINASEKQTNPHMLMHRHMPRLTQMTMAMSWALTMPMLCQIGVSQKTDQ